ncbi:MAG TPA: beta-N-acetylhexosaminidase [Steroidobacteraceae bacterium]|nr:beta-N-acetylhexosaminidase [Steroidobacteraceae bacterium]
MTLGCLMVDVAGRSLLPEDRAVLEHPLVGGVILFTRNYEDPAQLAALVAEIRALRSPPLLVACDQEGGRVQRFRRDFTLLPPMHRIGREYDLDHARGRELARETGWLLGAELRAVGIDLAFAPVVDLEYGVSEVIGDRAFHAKPDAVAVLAGALVAGLREAGMSATAKHFPGHGAVAADSHVSLPVDRRELADLGPDLTPYRRLIANGLPSVMMAHVVFPAVDALPASLSRRWVGDVLRGELDFRGAVFTDDLSMAGAVAFGGVVERSRLALAAGCDMLLVCNSRPAVLELLDGLDVRPEPVSALRVARLHGHGPAPGREARAELMASARWRHARLALERACEARPTLVLDGEAS